MGGVGYVTGNVTDGPLPLQIAIGVGVGLLVGVWATAIHRVVLTRRRMSARASGADVGDGETAEHERDADCLQV
jgi:membrane-associated protein